MKLVVRLPLFVVCALVLVLCPSKAAAEIAIGESIEWVVLDSDWVFTGKVIGVEKATGEDGKTYDLATVAVAKTLKGKHADRATFVLRSWIGAIAKDWKREGNLMLFCLVRRDRQKDKDELPAMMDWVIRDNHNDPSAVMLGKTTLEWPRTVPVLTQDFQVLTDPDAIVKRVEKALSAASKDGSVKPHTVDVPADTAAFKKLWSGSAVWLVVPVDEQLEAMGRKFCASPGYYERKEGAKILRLFKNAKNIEILKSMLDDPSFSTQERSRSVPGKKEFELVYRKKVFEVRRLAYEALRDFDVRVVRPVTEVLLEGRDP
jgi:hypothetical protein